MSVQNTSAVKSSDNAPISPLQQMVSSCSGALMTSIFVTPLDVVKIRLQAQQKPFHTGNPFVYHNGLMDHLCICSHCQANGNGQPPYINQARRGGGGSHGYLATVRNAVSHTVSQQPWYDRGPNKGVHFNGTVDAFVKIVRTEGLTSLWSGLPPTLVMAVPATVVYFTTYDIMKYRMGYQEGVASTQYIPVFAGCFARTFTTTLISPLELIRTKMQSEQLTYRDLGKAVRSTVRDGGASILMRGLGPTLLRDVPFSGVYWYGYEFLKAYQMRLEGNMGVTPKISQSFIAGALAGTVAALITLPFDVVKTHRQIELGQADFLHGKKLTSTWSLMVKLYSERGIQGLFAGIVPRIAKVTPACAIMITSYEYGKAFFREKNRQHLQVQGS